MLRITIGRWHILALAALAAVALGGSTASAVTVAEATGKGAFLDQAGQGQNRVQVTVSISFKAGVDDLGNVFGELQQKQNGPGTAFDAKFHGTILCFSKLSATVAVFGLVIDSASDPGLVGKFAEVKVVDNGEGGGVPDQYGIDITNQEPDCEKVQVQLHDLIRGNIQVH